ncbi:20511_t:CDS:2, partial [Entrophospora sp. SA101]
VRVLLQGDFEHSYTKADNSKIIPTDTMKNTIYILAKQSNNVQIIEELGIERGEHFLKTYPHVTKVTVLLVKHRWSRMMVDGKLHQHSFIRDGEELRHAKVFVERGSPGFSNLLVLKTTESAFYGFLKDKYTTLEETNDRILSTSIDSNWKYLNITTKNKIPFDNIYESIREITLSTFAKDYSASVQATLYLMAKLALEKHLEIGSIHYELPNKHYFAYNLERFNLKNTGKDTDIYSPNSDPSGLIIATVSRSKPKL